MFNILMLSVAGIPCMVRNIVLKLMEPFNIQVEVAVEGPREMIADNMLSQYTTEAVLFENFDDEGDFKMPSEAAHLQPQGLDSALIGCHAHTILKAQLQRPKLWSAEHVIYALIYLAATLSRLNLGQKTRKK